MRLTKRLLRSDSARVIFVWFIALYIRLVHFTTRWRTVMPAATRDCLAGDKPFIVCFWHGRMVMMRAGLPPNRKARMLISAHRDGLIISRAQSKQRGRSSGSLQEVGIRQAALSHIHVSFAGKGQNNKVV